MLLTAAYCFLVSLELPELEPELLPEPMPLLGDVVEPPLRGDVVELPLLEPLVPPAAPEPDLLKCASHSARVIQIRVRRRYY